MDLLVYGLAAVGGVWLLRKVYLRLLLSLAKHPSLGGHARMAQRVARLLPFYEFSAADFLAADGAPDEVVQQRRLGFERLAAAAAARAPDLYAALCARCAPPVHSLCAPIRTRPRPPANRSAAPRSP